MKLSELQQQFSQDVIKLLTAIDTSGFKFTFGETFRTKEQARIYAQKRKGIINSLHCKRLAIDINLFSKDNKYLTATKDHEAFGLFWENLNPDNRWGGRFKRSDGNHYERKDIR